MTQNNNMTNAIQEHDNKLFPMIRKVRPITLKKFLVYFCCLTNTDTPIYTKSRRAQYDYKLAREIVTQHLAFLDTLLFLKDNGES